MIITCPKCKTKFEVNENNLKNGEMKFQCSDCSFVWTEYVVLEKNKISSDFEDKDLPSCIEDDDNIIESKKLHLNSILSYKNILSFLLLVILVSIISIFVQYLNPTQVSKSSNIFNNVVQAKKELYIEIVKPLTLTKEGTNEYIIINGFIYNPTDVVMPVPKLLVKLENKDARILQEQEREVNVKMLNPLEKKDFVFKVFKFSSQVSRVKVEFLESNKI